MSRVRLVLALHDHQPIGNFDGVFEDSYRTS
jgi:alpha-amylase